MDEGEMMFDRPMTYSTGREYVLPPSIVNKIRAVLKAAANYKGKPKGPDFSHWKGKMPASAFDDQIDFMMSKASEVSYTGQPLENCVDTTLAHYAQVAHDIDRPFGAFCFVNPMVYVEDPNQRKTALDSNLLAFIKALHAGTGWKQVAFYHADAERWWTDYNSYNAWAKDRTKPFPGVISKQWCIDAHRYFRDHLIEAMEKGMLPKKPWGFYSAKWYVEGYAKLDGYGSLYDVFALDQDTLGWEAMYPDNTSYKLTWPQVNDHTPTVNPSGLCFKSPTFWQIADHWQFMVDGAWQAIDVNISPVDKAELYRRLNWTPAGGVVIPPAEPPIVPPVVPPAITDRLDAIDAALGMITLRMLELERWRKS